MFRILFLSAIATIIFSVSFASNEDDLQSGQPRGVIEDLINGKLEALKEQIPEPISITTPIQMPIIDIPEYIWGKITITNLYISGLKALNLTNLNITLGLFNSKLEFALLVENLNLILEYSNQFKLGNVSTEIIENNGAFKINLTELVIQGNSGLSLIPPAVKEVNSTINIETAKIEIVGLLNDDELSHELSEILTNSLVRFIRDFQDQIAPILNPIVEYVINNLLLK